MSHGTEICDVRNGNNLVCRLVGDADGMRRQEKRHVGVGSTKLTGRSKLAVQAKNADDESQVRMTLSGAGSDRVFWFTPDDAQALLNDILNESFDKLLRDVKVEQRMIRLK